jgi:hypothetical protein
MAGIFYLNKTHIPTLYGMADLVAELSKVVEEWGEELTDKLRESLYAKGQDASGVLAQGFLPKVFLMKEGMQFKLLAEDYYQYPDKGRRPGGSVGAIVRKLQGPKGWIAQKGIPLSLSHTVKRKTKSGVKQSIQKYKNIAQANKAASWAIAISIVRNGTTGSNYYSDVVNEAAFADLRKRIIIATANPEFIFQFIDPDTE